MPMEFPLLKVDPNGKSCKTSAQWKTIRLNGYLIIENIPECSLSQNALPYEEETSHMRLWFLSYRCPLHAWVRLSGLHSGDPRFQIAEGDGGVQAAWDVVWSGVACHIQGQDSGLQGETPWHFNIILHVPFCRKFVSQILETSVNI